MPNLWPEPIPDIADLDDQIAKPISFRPTFSGEFFRQIIDYPIIVHGWNKAVGKYEMISGANLSK